MTKPLALVFYQNPVTGNQLVNRLQDLKYRVQTVSTAPDFMNQSRTAGVMLVIADVDNTPGDLLELLRETRANEATRHLPVIAYASSPGQLDLARQTGCTLAVEVSTLLAHLPAVLDQALQVD